MDDLAKADAQSGASAERAPVWGAVFALSLCAGTVTASEFMPVSLLTPIAASLLVTEGRVGQASAVSGVLAVITSLLISSSTRGIDRRHLLLALTALMLVSGLTIAFAPTIEVFMAGRALIGVVIGGFWSMSAATIMRLVPADQVGKALSTLNVGNALAVTIAPPAAIFIGQSIGWRGAFLCVTPFAALALVWLLLKLPSMPSTRNVHSPNVFKVLTRPYVALGVIAVGSLFVGRFSLFMYLRPFLESVTHVDVSTLAAMLLSFGVAGLVGTYLVGFLLKRHLQALQVGMPLALAALAILLVAFGNSTPVVAVLITLWGMIGAASSVVWWTWLSRVLPHDAEAGGGLLVAVFQLAIAAGATSGGVLFDLQGYKATFGMSAAILSGSAILALVGWRRAVRTRSPSGR